MRKNDKKKVFIREQNDESDDTWLLTYGDMMTLLLVFFILLYALSTMNKVEINDIVNSMSNAFGKKELDAKEKQIMELRDSLGLNKKINLEELEDLNKVYEEINTIVENEKLTENIDMSIDNRGVVIRASESIFFRSGKAFILKEGQRFLYKIYPVLKESKYDIQVEGHTDNIPIHTRQFPSNWELSAVRATSVIRFFIEKCKLQPGRFMAMGFGEYRPIVENNTPANRAANRRVEIIVLRSKYQSKEE